MCLRSSKGLGIIAEQLLFAAVIMITIFTFIISASSNNIMQNNVEQTIRYEVGEVKKRSTVTTTFSDYMWRSPGIDRGKYDSREAYKVISYYFSTPGDTVYVAGNSIPRREVKSDIKDYLSYKMQKYWKEGPSDVDYEIRIADITEDSRPDEISVSSDGFTPSSNEAQLSFPIATNKQGSALVTYRTTTSHSIYGVASGE